MSILEDHQHRTALRQENQLLLEDVHSPLFANQIAHDRLERGVALCVRDRQQCGQQGGRLRHHLGRAFERGLELVELPIGRVVARHSAANSSWRTNG